MDDPYEGVDWERVEHLHSTSHEHTFAPNTGGDEWVGGEAGWHPQEVFDSLYDRGIRHFALSNYHPSKPTYPLADHFEDVPDDALGCPNAEHTGCGDDHYCAIGSVFESSSVEFDGTWRDLVRGALGALACPDGGGVVVAHPRRSGLSVSAVAERLDFDPRVLGIEVWNHRGVVRGKFGGSGDAVATWDDLLATGRQVFGFWNPDYHGPWDGSTWGRPARGRNVLLVPEPTEYAAARAYRRGQFYGALDGSGLQFERVETTEDGVAVETNGATRIEFLADGPVVQTTRASEGTYRFRGDETYVRVEAHDETGERLFSQPVVR